MDLNSILLNYFNGEKVEALVFILPMGLISLVFGAWLLTEGGAFARGVAIPCVAMGLLMATVGGVVGYRTPSQLRTLQTGFENQPAATQAAELQRMAKVNNAWPVYLALWATFAVVGLCLRFLTVSDLTRGLGISLIFFAGVALLIDGFAERRATIYTTALKGMELGAKSPSAHSQGSVETPETERP